MKRKPKLNPENYDPMSFDDFTEAVQKVLLKPMKSPPSENREPTKEEREKRYKLVRKDA